MSSAFRASPWVSYEPVVSHYNHPQSEMKEEAGMDAPQISTLPDEETPPPQTRKKVTLTVRKRPAPPPTPTEQWGNPAKKRATDDGEPEEEEDQLVDELIDDDDDDGSTRPTPSSQAGRLVDDSQKRKSSPKKKPRKSDKKSGDGDKKIRERIPQPTGAHIIAPTMSIFKATPVESREDVEMASSPVNQENTLSKAKKKAAPRKTPTVSKGKAKLVKQKSAIPPIILNEESAALSESYAGTAASSPVTAQFEQNSPEPENIPPSSPTSISGPLPDEPNLENVPIPVYPLPTKPFPVQPPQKIPTGTAPLIPLDKSKKHVRHWREANREIRGIAGGRWLTRTWVGEKESEFASYVVANAQAKATDDKVSSAGAVALPKLSSVSISLPASTKALGKLKASSKAGSAVTSANPSRAPSVTPEGAPVQNSVPVTSAVRAPTKMRILQLAPSSEGGDSDAPVAPDT
ncbi:hypothetical protein D9613_002286 [Agrocybe pediades]|uniref:Uncharacterized protein n=1 Tax=Agrocybe pediades TaxID=84607 RepID=A0A8H4R6I5_9AGAR|nr:hypothetical protein D9613_002286 [Agrocybe pediades]KAF9566958.1 hypothetical protein CPC08DRAFT_740413 [Agrocybe pediades]